MGRTSKFSFPLPGRKIRSQQAQDGKLPADEPKLSKAERLLGTTGIDFHNQPQRPRIPHHDLQPRPSFMTLTIAESNAGDDISEYDTGTSLSESVPPVPSQPQNLDDDRYKPVHYYEPVEPRHPRSMSHSNVPLVRHFKSSSTLRSQYDLNAAPISVSHQTSASAIRDRAMRKGSAPAIGREARLGTPQGWQANHPQEQELPTLKTDHKKRPTRLDLTKLFPKPSLTTSHQPLTTTHARSPTTMSSPSSFRPHRPLPPPHSDRSLSVKSPNTLTKTKQGLWRKPSSNDPRQVKKHVRRPSKKGRQNWFDGLLEEEDRIEIEEDEEEEQVPDLVHEVELEHEPELPHYTYPIPQDMSIPLAEQNPLYCSPISTPPPPLDMLVRRNSLEGYPRSRQASFVSEGRERSSIHSYCSGQPLESPRSIHSHLGSHVRKRPESLWSRQSPLPSPNNVSQKHPGSPWSRHSIGHSPLPSPNVLNFQHPEFPWSHHSPLGSPKVPNVNVETVSTDSESEDGDYESHFRPVRDSIAISELDDVVMIGQAEAFQVQPRRLHEAVELKRTGKQSVQETDSVDHTYTSPQTTPTSISFPRPPSHMSSFSGRASVIDSTRSRPPSQSAPPSARTSQYSQPAQRQPMEPQHKLMAVTEEEEALLEMMRSKRAAMASHSFAEGYKTALGQKSHGQGVRTKKRESISASSVKTSRSRLSQFDPPLSPPPTGALPTPPTSRRDSGRSEAPPLPALGTRHPKPTSTSTMASTSSVMTSFLDMGGSANVPSLAPDSVDIRLSPIATPAMSHPDNSPTPSNVSHVSLLPSPMTPYDSMPDGDIEVKVAGSSHASDSSEVGSENIDHSTPKFSNRRASLPGKRRTANSDIMLSYDEITSRLSYLPPGEPLPVLGDEISSGIMVGSYFGTNETSVRPATHAGGCAPHHLHACGGHEEIRCSVSEDVLAAWGSLGGWRAVEQFRLCGAGA